MNTDTQPAPRIGHFASPALVTFGVDVVGGSLCGRRFDRIELRLTVEDFINPHVQEWVRNTLLPRITSPAGLVIVVEATR